SEVDWNTSRLKAFIIGRVLGPVPLVICRTTLAGTRCTAVRRNANTCGTPLPAPLSDAVDSNVMIWACSFIEGRTLSPSVAVVIWCRDGTGGFGQGAWIGGMTPRWQS